MVDFPSHWSFFLEILARRLPQLGIEAASIVVASPFVEDSPAYDLHNRSFPTRLGRRLTPLDPDSFAAAWEDCLNSWHVVFVGDPACSFLRNWVISSPLTFRSGDEERDRYSVCFDPETGSVACTPFTDWAAFVRRRMYLVEKARDARRIGLLVGTLGVRNYDK
jgi:hypothetical protein